MIKQFEELNGLFYGKQKIWMEPGEAVFESPIAAEVENKKNKQAITISYTWRYNNETVKGSFLIEPKNERNYSCIWEDTWHNKNTAMLLEGQLQGSKIFSFVGSYGTKDNTLWGWKIKIVPGNTGIFTIYMYNISPDGQEMLAVDIFLYKVKPASYEQKLKRLAR